MIVKLTIGTRDSKLALIQTYWVRDRLLQAYPELKIEIIEIKTQGDKILDTALSKIGDKALFTKELENELLAETIDLAVHSMKDLSTQLPKGLEIAATTEREDVRDVVCFSKYSGVMSLDQAKVVATSSLRRKAQLQNGYPHIKFVDIRGNLQTRFHKLEDPANKLDAMVLAAAGLHRLGTQVRHPAKQGFASDVDTKKMVSNDGAYREIIGEYLDPLEILPAVGQGALAVEIKSGRDDLRELLREVLNSPVDEAIVKAERAFLRKLEGGCQVPIGVHASLQAAGKAIQLKGIVASLDGSQILRQEITGPLEQAEDLGQRLGQQFLKNGAREILQGIKSTNQPRS